MTRWSVGHCQNLHWSLSLISLIINSDVHSPLANTADFLENTKCVVTRFHSLCLKRVGLIPEGTREKRKMTALVRHNEELKTKTWRLGAVWYWSTSRQLTHVCLAGALYNCTLSCDSRSECVCTAILRYIALVPFFRKRLPPPPPHNALICSTSEEKEAELFVFCCFFFSRAFRKRDISLHTQDRYLSLQLTNCWLFYAVKYLVNAMRVTLHTREQLVLTGRQSACTTNV
jgi:hypothetical protein